MPKAKVLADQALSHRQKIHRDEGPRNKLSSPHPESKLTTRISLAEAEIDDREAPEVDLDIYLTVIPSQQPLETVVANKT